MTKRQKLFARVRENFEKAFGMPFPEVFLPHPDREPLSRRGDEHLAASQVFDEGLKLPVNSNGFDDAPVGTWATGHWGYGTNSYAWYFIRKDERRRVFLRLFWGGAYGDPVSDAACVREFTQRYGAFEKWAEGHLTAWSIEDDMGSCWGWVEREPGVRTPLEPGFEGRFIFPNEEEAWRELYDASKRLLKRGKVDEGLKAAQQALAAARSARQATALARLIVPWDRFGDAAYCYDKALSLDPECRPARYRIGRYASLDIARAKEFSGQWDLVWARLERWRKIRDRVPQGEGLEEAAARLRAALEAYMERREASEGEKGGDFVLGVVQGPGRTREISYRHPRDQGPGPFRKWTAVFYREAESRPKGEHGPWGERRSAGGGDPLSRGAAFKLLEEAVRGCWAAQGEGRV